MSGLKRVDYYYLIYYMHLAQLNTCSQEIERANLHRSHTCISPPLAVAHMVQVRCPVLQHAKVSLD